MSTEDMIKGWFDDKEDSWGMNETPTPTPAASTPTKGSDTTGALISGGMSLAGTLLGSYLNKPEQRKRTIGVSGFNNRPNSHVLPMFSDEDTKEDIHSADDKIRAFLSAIRSI